MITRELIDNALAGDDYSCGMIYALTNGDPVKLTDIGEDIATAVSEAHERALRRLAAYEARSADFAEHARLLQARLDRIHLSGNPDPDNPDTDPFFGRRASFMSDKISMDEAREKVRLDRDRQDPTDEQLDAYIASVRAAGIPVHEVPRTMAREDYDQEWARVRNAADLGSPRIP